MLLFLFHSFYLGLRAHLRFVFNLRLTSKLIESVKLYNWTYKHIGAGVQIRIRPEPEVLVGSGSGFQNRVRSGSGLNTR